MAVSIDDIASVERLWVWAHRDNLDTDRNEFRIPKEIVNEVASKAPGDLLKNKFHQGARALTG